MKFMQKRRFYVSVLGYATISTRLIKLYTIPSRWLTPKSTQSQKWMTIAVKIKINTV